MSAEEGKRFQLLLVPCPVPYQGVEEGGQGDQSVTVLGWNIDGYHGAP